MIDARPVLPGLLLLLLAACSTSQSPDTAALDAELREQIVLHGLSGNPAAGIDIPDIHSPRAQLGMTLFYSKTLGGEYDTACVSCHHPMLGGGDGLSLPVGVGAENPDVLGPGRFYFGQLPPLIPRNAPSTFNIALYKKHMFHDGRVHALSAGIATPDKGNQTADVLGGDNLVQAQARFPITSFAEMRGGQWLDDDNQVVRDALAARLQANWTSHFAAVLTDTDRADLVTEQHYSALIGDYERSQLFIETPWKHYVEGDLTAISDAAKRGALLFYRSQDEGGAACASCHSGDFFTNEEFYNVGIPQIGPGKGNGITATADYGCNLVTDDKSDRFKFRTPTLINVAATGPWGHNGAYTTLEAVTRHMLDPVNSAENYNAAQLTQPGINTRNVAMNNRAMLEAGLQISPKPQLKPEDVSDLVAFLNSLTDPCVTSRECLAPWIPSPEMNDPDGRMLHAKSSDGKLL